MTTKISRDQQLDYYVKLPYATRVLAYECDGKPCYMAVHPELEGCMAQGDTPAEAVQSLGEARRDYINALLDEGLEVPLPSRGGPVVTRADLTISAAMGYSQVQVLDFALPEAPRAQTSSVHIIALAT